MSKNLLKEKLSTTLENVEKLVAQLRDTKDYSEQSELYFLIRELILEQTGAENENSSYTNHQAR